MRILSVVFAVGLVFGAPILAPTAMLSKASAQSVNPLAPTAIDPTNINNPLAGQVDAILNNPTLTDAQKSDQLALLVAGAADPVVAAAQVVQAAGGGFSPNATIVGTALAKAAATVQSTNQGVAFQITQVASSNGGAVATAANAPQSPVAGANVVVSPNANATTSGQAFILANYGRANSAIIGLGGNAPTGQSVTIVPLGIIPSPSATGTQAGLAGIVQVGGDNASSPT